MFGHLLGCWYTIYIFGSSCSVTEFCQMQNSLCIQVLHYPTWAVLLHGTQAVGISQALRHCTFKQQGSHPIRHLIVELSSLLYILQVRPSVQKAKWSFLQTGCPSCRPIFMTVGNKNECHFTVETFNCCAFCFASSSCRVSESFCTLSDSNAFSAAIRRSSTCKHPSKQQHISRI